MFRFDTENIKTRTRIHSEIQEMGDIISTKQQNIMTSNIFYWHVSNTRQFNELHCVEVKIAKKQSFVHFKIQSGHPHALISLMPLVITASKKCYFKTNIIV